MSILSVMLDSWVVLEVAKCMLLIGVGMILGGFLTAWYYALKERDRE